MLLLAAVIICAIQFHDCVIHVGYFMEVESQAKAMSKNNSRVIITKGQKVNLPMQHNFEHECMILAIQHSKLDSAKIDTECAIFANVMNEFKHANRFLDTT